MFSSFQLPGCGDNVALVRNGFCNDETNIAACGYDGGDCCGPNVNTDHCVECACHFIENCAAGVHPLVGNGFCDEETNNIECNYDAGDCCGPDVSCKWPCLFHRMVWNQTKKVFMCYVSVFVNGLLKSRFFKNRELYWSNLPQNSNFGWELVQKSEVQIPVNEGQFFCPIFFSFSYSP